MSSIDVLDELKVEAAEGQEKKELILFQWLSSIEKQIPVVPKEYWKANQADLEKVLGKYIISTAPKPQKLLRDSYARVYALIYQHGETRTLFDTFAMLQTQLSNKKVEEISVKMYAFITTMN